MEGMRLPMAELCKKSDSTTIGTSFGGGPRFWCWVLVLAFAACAAFWFFGHTCMAQGSLPGSDASDKLEAAGTLLRLIDTALFKWGARIFAGICVMSAAWSLKEQRFGIAIVCIVGALIFGTAPKWVKNIFAVGSGDSIFSN